MDATANEGGMVGEAPVTRSGPGRLGTVVVIAITAAAILAVSAT